MSTPVPASDRPDGRPEVPTPPGGAPLRVNPARRAAAPAHLPVVDETSAGGLVLRPEPEGPGAFSAAVLLRRNRTGRLEWCLPKGHLEGRETPQEAAVREIHEETGIRGSIQAELGVIDYWFTGEDRRVHKVVHHYLLRAEGGRLTVEDDPDGEAEDALWVRVDELSERLSYPNEQRLAAVALDLLASSSGLRDALRADAFPTERPDLP
ncbi:NUDIX hydrolase [Promicromonospora citrea]|uniref:NUDIX hydrolase n=1 Tax=Promicromonospora citrea TaxID=43677 RepID=UPI001489A180|nr:NUDIX hydrolase [Promicromonospora citrea]NNH50757.1 NUDIX hydrolase [Promicromonospora citrea]